MANSQSHQGLSDQGGNFVNYRGEVADRGPTGQDVTYAARDLLCTGSRRRRIRPNPTSAVPNRAKLAGSGTGVFGVSPPDTASKPVLPAPGPEVFVLIASTMK